jgi:shikimate kinase
MPICVASQRSDAMHVWLIGMMGTGKTTVGAMIAEELSLPLIDTDAEVMTMTGRTIPELFAESEASFRSVESSVITALADGPPSVISTGGGAILDPVNVAAMRGSGHVVLLEASPADLEARLDLDGSRPLLGSRDDIRRIAEERLDRYRCASHHRIMTDGRSARDVASEVLACLDT